MSNRAASFLLWKCPTLISRLLLTDFGFSLRKLDPRSLSHQPNSSITMSGINRKSDDKLQLETSEDVKGMPSK